MEHFTPPTIHTLSHGVRVVLDPMPSLFSATVSCWLDGTAVDWSQFPAGTCHFMEHLLFKQKKETTAVSDNLFNQIENSGGTINALTDKETTCFYARLPHRQVPKIAGELVALLLQHGDFFETGDTGWLADEKTVIQQEIESNKQRAEGLIIDPWMSRILDGDGLSQPVIGSLETVKNLTVTDLKSCYTTLYRPENLIISISGRFEQEQVIEAIESQLAQINTDSLALQAKASSPQFSKGRWHLPVSTSGAMLCVGGQGLKASDNRRYQLSVLDTILGSGMNSLLFDRLRRQQSLVYGVNTFQLLYSAAGLFGIVAQTQPHQLQAVYDGMMAILDELASQTLDNELVENAKSKVSGSLLMNLESPRYRAARNARGLIYQGQVQSLIEAQQAIKIITPADLQQLAKQLFTPEKLSLAVIGPDDASFIQNMPTMTSPTVV